MSASALPRTPFVTAAILLARQWCEGQVIDGSPAIGHALKVARKVVEHVPGAAPDLIAAVILHDAPYFAPTDIDLDATLARQLSPAVSRLVRAIQREHDTMDKSILPEVSVNEPDAVIASAADKVVSVGAILHRARHAANPSAFWSARTAFLNRTAYFVAFAEAARSVLPPTLTEELERVVNAALIVTGPYVPAGGTQAYAIPNRSPSTPCVPPS
ncbi:hypothetical protein [Krasilnikovia sp. M28-CT-15]|uniref:hypothetical protein n=1 Tax=Krasilnikovia sp. M28-CT-15 TaxID=3373540 RepID=UPI003876B12C